MKYIDINSTFKIIKELLLEINFLKDAEEILSIEKPGEGNMNVVLRVKTNQRSFIVKQSRPFVQKYQDIPAPEDRIDVEYQFYKAIESPAVTSHIPEVLAYDAENYVLILEDLGNCEDMSLVYKNRAIETESIQLLVDILSNIHKSEVSNTYPENKELRALNHQHIFVLPFVTDNGFSLDTIQDGLEEVSQTYKNDKKLKEQIALVGERYLSEGTTLLHGDYYPGSWMTKEDDVFVIDPEFSFKGFPEFDLGVMAAHMVMATGNKLLISTVKKAYTLKFDERLFLQITGIEIMRRLIGLAQLPLDRTLEEKKELLEIARLLIVD
ncbi:phosphotransferase [Polaribacter undariae]|uniref:Phosphotransferase n=1 Tax=Polaribacter sejongensis TaxID=985043 RepID=A0AAJ1VFN1_9FLAO|nr:phosphotransferase [Polaribacter undariae]MDN3618449.1 phosphotransferase [Polaribacter undariae]UWD30568.1 phosphotransferase [Polaribacter undariae]